MMAKYLRVCFGILASWAFLQGVALADSGKAPPPSPGYADRVDWTQYAQEMLSDLQGKLNLSAGQEKAWKVWSSGVLDDARTQQARVKKAMETREKWIAPEDMTALERMDRRIEHLKAAIPRIQANLDRLQAARVRTHAFYAELDAKQKVIFDLYLGEEFGGHRMHVYGKHPGRYGRHEMKPRDSMRSDRP